MFGNVSSNIIHWAYNKLNTIKFKHNYMYFLDVMTFDPTLTKYISTDPTKTIFIFSTSMVK